MGRLRGSPGARRLPCHFSSLGGSWLVHDDGVGAAPAAPGCAGAVVHRCSSSRRVCQPLANASSQCFPFFPSVRAAGGGAFPKWLAAGKEVGLEEPLPDVRSCVRVTAAPSAAPASPCARLRREAAGSRRRGRSLPPLSGRGVTSLHVAGPSGQELLSVGSACQKQACPQRVPRAFTLPSSD